MLVAEGARITGDEAHGCDIQRFRVADTFETMELAPPNKADQQDLLLAVPVEAAECDG